MPAEAGFRGYQPKTVFPETVPLRSALQAGAAHAGNHEPDAPPCEHDELFTSLAASRRACSLLATSSVPEPGALLLLLFTSTIRAARAADPVQNQPATQRACQNNFKRDYVPSAGGHQQPHEPLPPDPVHPATEYDAFQSAFARRTSRAL